MVTSMIPNVNNVFKNPNIIDMRFLSPYNPLINYDWSTTTASGLRYLKDVGSTPTYNASMYFGRGAYLNGVDQTITIPINTTIQTALKRVNGVITINETSQTLTDYVISGLGVHKDYYLFTRLLTTAEKDSYTNTPELFYAMAQADSTCVLNMPMCETSSTARNYRTGIGYPITNYTTSVRDNAKNLQYGLQTCKFVRDSLGVIQSASDYLECDGVGYADTGWIPSTTEAFTLEFIVYYDGGLVNGRYGATNNVYGNQDIDRWFYLLMGAYYAEAMGQTPKYINITITYDGVGTVSFYRDAVKKDTQVVVPTGVTIPFHLGKQNGLTSQIATQKSRLFKVHNKVLTQEEIMENYNSYVAKGLLS